MKGTNHLQRSRKNKDSSNGRSITPPVLNHDVASRLQLDDNEQILYTSIFDLSNNAEASQTITHYAPWMNQDGSYKAESSDVVDPLGLRIGGKDKNAPEVFDLRPIMNGFRGAVQNILNVPKGSPEAKEQLTTMRKINSELRTMVNNEIYSRAGWLMNSLLDPRGRDLYRECGYPDQITPQMYGQMYKREPIAKRVVDIFAEECWENICEVYEDDDEEKTTDFEKAIKDLDASHHLWHYLERIDKLSGIGSYGLLLLGINDGLPLNLPIEGLDEKTGELKKSIKPHELLYMRAFDESLCHVGRWNTDQTTPRYAQPEIYLIRFLDYTVVPIGQTVTDVITHMVHWSRVVHVADNRMSSEVFGVPRMEPVFNRLLDLRKLYGGSAEMFWKGGFPGIGLEVMPELADAEIDQGAVREQMEAYQNSLRRYFAVTGMSIKTLTSSIQKPKEHVDCQLQAISIATGVPWRVFSGAEQAVKAGEQDSDAWDVRLQRRKNQYLTPLVIRPVVDRLIAMGVLPIPKQQFKVSWPESSAPTEKDKSAIATARSQAISTYLMGNGEQIIAPLDFLVTVLGLDKIVAQEIIDNAQEFVQEQQEQQAQQQQGGLPGADQLAQATGMDEEDAQTVMQAIQQIMQQQAQQQQGQQQGNPESSTTGADSGAPYTPGPAKTEDATGGISGGVSGGIGSSGATGTPGGVPWAV